MKELYKKLRRIIAEKLPFTNSRKFLKLANSSLQNADPESIKFIFKNLNKINRYKYSSKFKLQPYKLLCLEKICHKFRPKSILELGSGASTPILVRFAQQYKSKITSVEESEKWLKTTKKIVSENISSDALPDFILTSTSWNFNTNPPAVKYDDIPTKKDWDMIFIDGPTLNYRGKHYKNAVCANIIGQLDQGFKGVIVVDMRKPTVDWLIENLTDEWSKKISHIYQRKPVQEFNYFSVFHT